MWKLKTRHAEQEILPPTFIFNLNTFPKYFSLDAVTKVMESCLIGKEHVNSEQAISLK